jgi:hypothetical protein
MSRALTAIARPSWFIRVMWSTDLACSVAYCPGRSLQRSLSQVIRSVFSLTVVLAIVSAGCAATTIPGAQPSPQVIYVTPAPTVGSPASSVQPLPSTTPAPTASPDPEAVRVAAAKAYLAAAETSNRANKALNKKYPKLSTLARVHAYYKASAKIDATFIGAIKRIVVPADTAGDLHSLVARMATVQADDLEAAAARTWLQVLSVDRALAGAVRASNAAANLVRADLNLPPIHF